MDRDIRGLAIKQYFKYFIVWFLVAILLILLCTGKITLHIVNFLVSQVTKVEESANTYADPERVFDYADVLTDEQERALRNQIESAEEEYKLHIVLVTGSLDAESGATSWEIGMRDYADDFYDERFYGYDKPRGTGVLLFDNWYPGQEGSWLSTCGDAEDAFGDYEIDRVVDAVYDNISDPYTAYSVYVKKAARLYSENKGRGRSVADGIPFWIGGFIGSAVIALVYMSIHMAKQQSTDTTDAYTYVWNKKPEIKNQRDDFLRKNVTTVRIPKSTGSSSGSRGGGHHTSRSGVSHGGGGRRR